MEQSSGRLANDSHHTCGMQEILYKEGRMKIQLKELFQAKDVLQKIFNEPMEIKLSYRLSKISRKVESELKEINEQRLKLIDKYADEQKPEDVGKKPKQVSKRMEEFVSEFTAFLDTETDIDIQPIPFSLLQNIKLSANDLIAIEKFIEEDKDGKKN